MDTVCVSAAVTFALLRPLRDLRDELDAVLLPGESELQARARRDAAADLAAEGWLPLDLVPDAVGLEEDLVEGLEVAACSA